MVARPNGLGPRKTALARASNIYKRQIRPFVREGVAQKQDCNCQTVINIWSWAPDGARHQDLLTDCQSQCHFDFDFNFDLLSRQSKMIDKRWQQDSWQLTAENWIESSRVVSWQMMDWPREFPSELKFQQKRGVLTCAVVTVIFEVYNSVRLS
jgi:hypothetical protein